PDQSGPRPSRHISGTVVRDRDEAPSIDVGRASDHSDPPTIDIANVSGTAREKSRRTICDFFSKTRKRFCGTRKAKRASSRPHEVCYWGSSEVSDLREFFDDPKRHR